MKKQEKYHLDVEIDKLTNSILNTISGDSFPTDVNPVTRADLKKMTIQNRWFFNLMKKIRLYFSLIYTDIQGKRIYLFMDAMMLQIPLLAESTHFF